MSNRDTNNLCLVQEITSKVMVLLFYRTIISFDSNPAFFFQLASLDGLYNHSFFNFSLNQLHCPFGSIIKEFISIIIILSVFSWHMFLFAWKSCWFGEGNGTPLQYSCLENPMDGGAWWAAVHGVAKSWTRLRDFPFTFHFHALEKEMATHSSVLAWRIPGTGESGGLPSLGSHRVGHDWSDLAAAAAYW